MSSGQARCGLTQKRLDVAGVLGENTRVKPVMTVCAVLVAAVAASCAPKTTSPDQLRKVHEQNAELRREIASMEKAISRAGEDTPELPENITAKEARLADAVRRLDEANARETELKLRVIELQDRLSEFRASFRMLQNEVANTASQR